LTVTGAGLYLARTRLESQQERSVVSRTEPRDTRTAILDTAEEILQRRSYNSFSYGHISETLGLRKASLHYHFPTKNDLGLALIARYRARFRQWCAEVGVGGRGPREALQAYVGTFEECLGRSQVCAGGVLGVEYNTFDGPMQAALRDLYEDHYGWLAGLLEQGRQAGVFVFPGSAEAQATLLSAALQGAVQQGRCGPGRFRQALDQLVGLFTVAEPSA
jgi:TetR/AcrR family transcriptional regulator, transcriptional repressor for nem operon